MGYRTEASGTSSTAMGSNTDAFGDNSTAMGSYTTASGDYSTAMGYNTDASGDTSTAMGSATNASGPASTAMGSTTTASGSSSTAMGRNTIASGTSSTAMGFQTEASGNFSTAMGIFTEASGTSSTAMGQNTIASGDYSTAMGYNTDASGSRSTAIGNNTDAFGDYSTAMGFVTNASGLNSTAMGRYTTAPSAYETVIGMFNTAYTPSSTISIEPSDRLFVVGNGNGSSTSARSDAMVILKNGNIGIGTSAPTSDLHITQSISDYPNPTTGGIILEEPDLSSKWQIWNSNPSLSFAYNNVRVARVDPTSGSWIVLSDRRVKNDIEPMEDVLSKVLQLNSVRFRYDHNNESDVKIRGFIAQEVQAIFPDLVYTEDGSQLAIAPSDFAVLSIKAIQEQQELIKDQQERIEWLEKELNSIKYLLQDKISK
tara:strand:- start:461 stop:1741 length:1281 start_codon:yes stop_codon:yes gene_type:complete